MESQHIPEEFIHLFPVTSNSALATHFTISITKVGKWARARHLVKDPAYKRAMQRQRALGHTLSEDARERIRQKALGRKRPQSVIDKAMATKRANGSILRRERHPMWKGGRSIASRHINPAYTQWRMVVFERDGYRCQDCGREGTGKKHEGGLHAHHLQSYSKFPALRYEVSNGLTLCSKCHSQRHKIPFTKKPPPEYIECACGCGTRMTRLNERGQPRRYVNHHAERGRRNGPIELEKIRQAQLGRKHTTEHKEKIRQAMLGRTFTPEHRANLSKATTGRRLSESHIAKLRGRTKPPEERAKISASQKARLALHPPRPKSEEARRKTSIALKGRTKSPEHRSKISASKRQKNAAKRNATNQLSLF